MGICVKLAGLLSLSLCALAIPGDASAQPPDDNPPEVKIEASFDVDGDFESTARDIQLVINDALGAGSGFDTDLDDDFFITQNDIVIAVDDRLGFYICPGKMYAPPEPKQVPLYTIIGADFVLGEEANEYIFGFLPTENNFGTYFSTIAFTVYYDNEVVQPIFDDNNPFILLSDQGMITQDWYQKTLFAAQCYPGRIEVVVYGLNNYAMTGCDNQIAGFPHDPFDCLDFETPLALGGIFFEAIGPPGSVSAVAFDEVTAADSFGGLITQDAFQGSISTINVAGELDFFVDTVLDGFVYDSSTNFGVPNAVIELTPTGGGDPITAETEFDGYFFYPSLSPGDYNVRIFSVGYGVTTHGTITVSDFGDFVEFDVAANTGTPQITGQTIDDSSNFALLSVFCEVYVDNELIGFTYSCGEGFFEFIDLRFKGASEATLRFTTENYDMLEVQTQLNAGTTDLGTIRLRNCTKIKVPTGLAFVV